MLAMLDLAGFYLIILVSKQIGSLEMREKKLFEIRKHEHRQR